MPGILAEESPSNICKQITWLSESKHNKPKNVRANFICKQALMNVKRGLICHM